MPESRIPPRGLSLDALLFALLAAPYLSMMFLPPLPELLPEDLRSGALVVMCLGGYWLLDLLPRRPRLRRVIGPGKYVLIALAVLVIVVAPTLAAIDARRQAERHEFAHDGLMQSESATQFVLLGRNPYVESYADTPMGKWEFDIGGVKINPGLEHYAYLPLTFLLPLPAQALAGDRFDHRWVYLAFYAVMLILSARLTRDETRRLSLLLILALNPLFVPFFVEGRNDVLSLFWLVLIVLAVQRRQWALSAVWLALACATKQFAWFLTPFWLMLVAERGTRAEQWSRLKRPLAVLAGGTALLLGPWLLWDAAAFVGDVTYLQSGPAGGGYPVSGFSLGILLLAIGVMKSPLETFPYWLFQLAAALPLLIIMLRRQWREPSVTVMLMGAGLFTFVLGFFSQFFHDNHVGFIIAVMALAQFGETVIGDGLTVGPGN